MSTRYKSIDDALAIHSYNVVTDRDPISVTHIYKNWVQPCLAECAGVSVFVFLSSSALNGGSVLTNGIIQGLTIAALAATFGKISGAHLNPAVTLGVFLSGGIDLLKAVLYIVFQLLGGIIGGAKTKFITTDAVYEKIHGGSTLFPDSTTIGQGILAEMLMTSILVLVVLMTVMDDEWKSPLAPIAIGLIYLICIASCGAVTGPSMNPAQSFGTAVVTSSIKTSQWDYHYIYWVGPLLGSLVGALEYRILFGNTAKRLFF